MTAVTDDPNAGQRAYWNADVGRTWSDHADVLDAAFVEVRERVVARAGLAPGERVLDIGCGAGATTLAAARAVGADGTVLGIDLSEPLLALARHRLAEAGLAQGRVELADAQTGALPPAAFDAAISRFGVMFFSDPAAAFGNIGAALVPGGRVAFAAWAPLAENPLFAIPSRAAVGRLGPMTPSMPREPGPMAFAERDYFAELLVAGGFVDVEVAAEDVILHHAGPPEAAARLLVTAIGPASRLIRERSATEADIAAILAATVADLAPLTTASGAVRLPARLNVGMARRP